MTYVAEACSLGQAYAATRNGGQPRFGPTPISR